MKPVWEIFDSGYWRHEKGVSPMSPGSIIHIITNLTRNPTQRLKNPGKKSGAKIILQNFFEAWAHACEVSLVELTFVALHVIHKIKWITKNRPTASIIEIFRDLFIIIKIASFWHQKKNFYPSNYEIIHDRFITIFSVLQPLFHYEVT